MKALPLAILLGAVLLLSHSLTPAVQGGKKPAVAADLVLSNGKIWTVSKKQPEAQALAVWHGRVLAIGSNEDVQPFIGPATQVIDLKQRRVVPGFHDSHVHLLKAAPAAQLYRRRVGLLHVYLGQFEELFLNVAQHLGQKELAHALPPQVLAHVQGAAPPQPLRAYAIFE